MKAFFKDINGDSNIEFYNYWKIPGMDFCLFRISRIDEVFAHSKALQIIIFNFEIRFYISERKNNEKNNGTRNGNRGLYP